MALTDIQVKTAKPKGKDYKLFDGGGLYLLVPAKGGGKLWRFKYRFGGKEKLLALGTYPDVSLLEARRRHQEARTALANGHDPGALRKALNAVQAEQTANAENTFEKVAREWHAKFSKQRSGHHAKNTIDRLNRYIFPWIGGKPVSEIKPPDVLAIMLRIEAQGHLETAHRVRNICGQVLRYAVATGRAERDCTADLKGALPPVKEKHFGALVDPQEVAGLLRAIDDYKGTLPVKCALRLAPLLFVRPGELRQMEWAEIDFENAQINIPAERMKMKQPHIVPLSRQALAILRELQPLTGQGRYLFPHPYSAGRPMSSNAITGALRRMGFTSDEMTGHGFRAMARTILDEVLQVRPDFIEHQLAHAVRDPNGRAYNRTAHLTERRKMMQLWADYLDGLKAGAKVIPLKKAEG